MPTGTSLAVFLGAVVALSGCETPARSATPVVESCCQAPAPSATPVLETCIDLATSQAVALSWSQTGTYLGIGTIGPDGSPGARVIDADGRSVGAPIDGQALLPETVVVTPEGRLAWLERRGAGTVLVEDRADGRHDTTLPSGVDGLGWTAIGFALLQHPSHGGTRVLNLDVDRPEAPTVSYETGLFAERLWISADPENLLLTISHPDHRDAPTSFHVVLSEVEHQLEPAGADSSGASMSALRRWVVYHSAATSRMQAVKVSDPQKPIVLRDRAATRGSVSDGGVLAFVPFEPYGQVCLVEVGSSVP